MRSIIVLNLHGRDFSPVQSMSVRTRQPAKRDGGTWTDWTGAFRPRPASSPRDARPLVQRTFRCIGTGKWNRINCATQSILPWVLPAAVAFISEELRSTPSNVS